MYTNTDYGDLFNVRHTEAIAPGDASKMAKLDDLKQQSVELTLYAAAQSMALSKLKIFNSMAKQVNDQQ